MEKKCRKLNSPCFRSLRIALFFAFFSVLYILFSDKLVLSLFKNVEVLTTVQTIKGWIFVLVTAVLIFFLLKREIEKHQKAEEKFRRLVESLEREYFMYSHNTDGVFAYISPSITSVLGYTQEDFLAHYSEYMTDNPINKDVEHHSRQSIKGLQQPPYKVELFHKNSGVRLLEVLENPIFNEKGDVIAVEGIAHDITEQKQAEKALAKSETQFRSFMDNFPDHVYIKNNELKHIYANHRTLSLAHKPIKEIAGTTSHDLFAPEVARQLEESDRLVLKENHPVDLVFSYKSLTGEKGWLRDIKFPIEMPDGEGLLGGIAVDITEQKQALEKLQVSERNYRTLFDAAGDAIIIRKLPDGRCVDCNKKALEMLRCRSDQIIDKIPGDISPPTQADGRDSHKKAQEVIDVVLKQGSLTFEWQLQRSNGEVFDTEVTLTLLEIDSEKFIQSIIRDISERKQMEDALAISEKKYRTLIDSAADAILLHKASNGTIVEVNRKALDIFKCTAEEMIGKSPADFSASMQADGRGSFERVREIVAGLPEQQTMHFEWLHKRHDGEVFDAEVSVSLLETESDKYIQSIVRDITERKRLYAELRYERDFNNLLIHASPMFLVTLDGQGKTLIMNQAMLNTVGYSQEEVFHKDYITLFVPKEDQEVVRETFNNIAKENKATVNENRVVAKDGREILVEWHGRPIMNSDGEFDFFFGVGIDITERKRLQKELHQAQKMEALGTLAGGISHDFNNILSAIFGYIEMAEMHIEKPDKLQRDLGEAFKGAKRAKDLVKQILTFSRQREFEAKPIQPRLVIKEALKLMQPSLPTSIQLRQDVQSESLVLADPTNIHQVIMNLCTNAYHAMEGREGMLDVTLTDCELDESFTKSRPEIETGKFIKLSVSDNGHGMTQETLDKIFDPFFTTKAEGKGTGLGLAVVHGIVKDCKGTITAYSELGKGTTFNVFLPVVQKELAEEEQVALQLPEGSESILFVDDEEVLLNIGEEMLTELGYQIVTMSDPVAALNLFKENPQQFDILISDITMPEMSGVELVKEIKALRPDMPIILATGFSANITEDSIKDIGVARLLMKPLIKKEMVTAIREVLDKI